MIVRVVFLGTWGFVRSFVLVPSSNCNCSWLATGFCIIRSWAWRLRILFSEPFSLSKNSNSIGLQKFGCFRSVISSWPRSLTDFIILSFRSTNNGIRMLSLAYKFWLICCGPWNFLFINHWHPFAISKLTSPISLFKVWNTIIAGAWNLSFWFLL